MDVTMVQIGCKKQKSETGNVGTFNSLLIRVVADGQRIQKRPGCDRHCRTTVDRRKEQELVSNDQEFKTKPGISGR